MLVWPVMCASALATAASAGMSASSSAAAAVNRDTTLSSTPCARVSMTSQTCT